MLNKVLNPIWKYNTHALKRWWTTKNKNEVFKVKTLIDAEYNLCGCRGMVYGPPHMNTFIEGRTAYSWQCGYGGRWYDPATGKMEGSAHCACRVCLAG